MESDYLKLKWGGYFSAWGQGEKNEQNICYGSFFRTPFKKDLPINFFFPRFVSLDLAQYWLMYLTNHIVPEEVLKHVIFSREWPKKWNYEMGLREIADGYDPMSLCRPDPDKPETCTLTPWMTMQVSQELSSNSMFALAVLVRYVSEHGPVVGNVLGLETAFPKIPKEQLLWPASTLAVIHNHGLGKTTQFPTKSRIKANLADFNWRESWIEMEKNSAPFHRNKNKAYLVDSFFDPIVQSSIHMSTEELRKHEVNGVTFNVPRNGTVLLDNLGGVYK